MSMKKFWNTASISMSVLVTVLGISGVTIYNFWESSKVVSVDKAIKYAINGKKAKKQYKVAIFEDSGRKLVEFETKGKITKMRMQRGAVYYETMDKQYFYAKYNGDFGVDVYKKVLEEEKLFSRLPYKTKKCSVSLKKRYVTARYSCRGEPCGKIRIRPRHLYVRCNGGYTGFVDNPISELVTYSYRQTQIICNTQDFCVVSGFKRIETVLPIMRMNRNGVWHEPTSNIIDSFTVNLRTGRVDVEPLKLDEGVPLYLDQNKKVLYRNMGCDGTDIKIIDLSTRKIVHLSGLNRYNFFSPIIAGYNRKRITFMNIRSDRGKYYYVRNPGERIYDLAIGKKSKQYPSIVAAIEKIIVD